MHTPNTIERSITPAADPRGTTLRRLADSLQKQINDKRRPMTQGPTPKRMREYNSRLLDGDNLERTQRALRAIADAREAGTLPPVLEPYRTTKAVAELVYKGTKGGGYYDVIPDPEYRNTSPAARAVQAMIDGTFTSEELAERARAEKIRRIEDSIRFVQIDGFFPTPAPVVRMMLERADVEPGMKVLEPSAGKGDIADALREAGAEVDTVEIRSRLCELLEAKGHRVTEADFLTYDAGGYDRVVMNPPFERYEYVDHVRRAYDRLRPGGRLVSLIPAGASSTRKPTEFREWCDELGADIEDLPAGSFTGPGVFRTTGTSIRMLIIDKPKGPSIG